MATLTVVRKLMTAVKKATVSSTPVSRHNLIVAKKGLQQF